MHSLSLPIQQHKGWVPGLLAAQDRPGAPVFSHVQIPQPDCSGKCSETTCFISCLCRPFEHIHNMSPKIALSTCAPCDNVSLVTETLHFMLLCNSPWTSHIYCDAVSTQWVSYWAYWCCMLIEGPVLCLHMLLFTPPFSWVMECVKVAKAAVLHVDTYSWKSLHGPRKQFVTSSIQGSL